MLSAFSPISDSFVAVGTTDSTIELVRFPSPSSVEALSRSNSQGLLPNLAGEFLLPIQAHSLGKCSHKPVEAIAHNSLSPAHAAAASAATVSHWDLVKGSRARLWNSPDHCSTCNYVGESLVAAAGRGCSLHLFDIRSASPSPAWTAKLASDNLYTSAVDGCSVFVAGADGSIYAVDLRAQSKAQWVLQPTATQAAARATDPMASSTMFMAPSTSTNPTARSKMFAGPSKSVDAVLDLRVLGGNIYFTRESGVLCGLPRDFAQNPGAGAGAGAAAAAGAGLGLGPGPGVGQKPSTAGDFLFTCRYSSSPFTAKVGCDALRSEHHVRLAAGSENGKIYYWEYNLMSGAISHSADCAVAASTVFGVRWAPLGLYVCTAAGVRLLPFRSAS